MVATVPAFYAPADMARKRAAYNVKEPTPGTLGFYVRHRRENELNISQQELAARIVDLGGKMKQGDVSDLELSDSLPRPPKMRLLAQALEVPIGKLYEEAGHPDHAEIGSSFDPTRSSQGATPSVEWVETLSDEQWEHLTRLREKRRQEEAQKQSSKKSGQSRSHPTKDRPS